MESATFQNTKLFSFEDLKLSSLPSKEQFFALESHKMLMSSRPVRVSVFFRLLMMVFLSFGAPLYLVVTWAVVSFSVNHWLLQLIDSYAKLITGKPLVMSEQMKLTADQFKNVNELNYVIWAGACILAQFWLPDLPKALVHILLGSILYLQLTKNCANLKVMHRLSYIILGLPFLAALFRFMMNRNDLHAISAFFGLSFYLGLSGYLLWLVGFRFHSLFLQRCEADYSNMLLIENLEQSHEKLRVEQEALMGANLVIQQFYSAAAHDLRQPVYAMEIYTDLLRDDPSKLDSLLPKIAQSCMSINAMFNDLFDFQQKHLSDTQLEQTKVNISDTLESLALHFEPIAASKKLSISFKPLDGTVKTIPLYFIRILSNLIANAITYTPTGGILVAARKSGKYLSFEIWDTGPGIDKSAQEKIFDEFYRINSDGRKTSNLGLGLAIVKELVSRLDDAKIRVSSVMGNGTVFKLLLPISTYSSVQEPYPIESTMHYGI